MATLNLRRYGLMSILLLTLLCLFQTSCASRRGSYHQVRQGETLYRISKAYGVPVDKLVRINNLQDAGYIRRGQWILVPEGAQRRSGVSTTPRKTTKSRRRQISVPSLKGKFDWPLKGRVLNEFGNKGSKRHPGIDVEATEGAVVRTIGPGEVIYSGDQVQGYGRTVIIKHEEAIFSLYSYLSSATVKKGQRVPRGAQIGKAGKATVDHFGVRGAVLHLEVRERTVPINPMLILP